MILQALYEYYQRKASDPESGIAPEGFEWKEIPFVCVIDSEGKFVRFEDTREGEGKKRRPKAFLVPAGEKKSSGIKANLLWDNVEYALGANPRERKDIKARHTEFVSKIKINFIDHKEINLLLKFLDANPISQIEGIQSETNNWNEIKEANSNIIFRIEGSEFSTLCESAQQFISRKNSIGGKICLVSGEKSAIARIHPSIKNVRGAQSVGAALLSFNLSAFRSYGKEQNFNSPVSEFVTFAYTTALNHLLHFNSKNKVQVGDATTVFWSEKTTELDENFFSFWSVNKDDPDKGILAVEALLKSPFIGDSSYQSDSKFYILGLSPNAARLSVRYWYSGKVSEISNKIRQHFFDLKIIESKNDKKNYALFFLLSDIALEEKIDNIPPTLAGSIMQSILSGGPYPVTLMQQAVRRIRAKQNVKRSQAAVLKAYLNRKNRFQKQHQEEEITVALDLTNTNSGYRLGRLFAALEKIQEDSHPNINATIRDRFYGSASSNPITVFPQLLKLKNHHLSKISNVGSKVNHEKRLGEIFSGLNPDMPSHLTMEDQARFAIGYYHQRQDFFVKPE